MYKQTSVNGEDFIGLLGLATEKYAILCNTFKDAKVLEVPVIKTNIYGTNLIGLFCTGNSRGLLLPYFTEKEVVAKIKKEFSEYAIDATVSTVRETCTALGNLVACNDKAAIISPKFNDTRVFEDTLGVEVVKRTIAKHDESGACCVATNRGFLAHPEAEEELEEIKGILKVPGREGTVNFGFPFPGSGLIANTKGYITGLRTSGIEMGRIDDALGFV
ncbi:MAG: translation initiation factor IF-6 [Candidatus Altiarchaeota archaeon]|nr:translation initiation factor IF-6 [Candidatus Altiarchaeota archaeon]